MPRKPKRREWGSGSITWLGPSKALLRISTSAGVRSKTITTAHRDHGGRGQAEEALAKFEVELNVEKDSPAGETFGSVMTYYVRHVQRLGKRRGTIETYETVAKRLPDDLKARPIETVTPDDLDHFYGQLKDRRLSHRTIRTTHAVIRAALKQAAKSGAHRPEPSRGRHGARGTEGHEDQDQPGRGSRNDPGGDAGEG